LAGVILTVHEVTHTVYSYFMLMLDISASVILSLTYTKELELWTAQILVCCLAVSLGKNGC